MLCQRNCSLALSHNTGLKWNGFFTMSFLVIVFLTDFVKCVHGLKYKKPTTCVCCNFQYWWVYTLDTKEVASARITLPVWGHMRLKEEHYTVQTTFSVWTLELLCYLDIVRVIGCDMPINTYNCRLHKP